MIVRAWASWLRLRKHSFLHEILCMASYYRSMANIIFQPTTLTITDCPCTISKPVYSTSVVQCSTWYLAGTQEFKNIKTDFKSSTPAPLPGTGAPGAPTPSVPGAPVPYPTGNATVPAGSPSAPAGSAPGAPGAPGASTVPAGSETPSPSSPAESGSASASASAPISTGAASKGYAPAGLAGLLGLAAYLL